MTSKERLGGLNRAKALSDERRSQIAKTAADVRWGNPAPPVSAYALLLARMEAAEAVIAAYEFEFQWVGATVTAARHAWQQALLDHLAGGPPP